MMEGCNVSAQVILTATQGPLQGQEFTFDRALCVVGRSHSCRLQTPQDDVAVSRRHCLLDIDAPTVQVQDLGSLNGTYVNGVLIGQRDKRLKADEVFLVAQRRYDLRDGDDLRVGGNTFHVHIASDDDTEHDEGECPEENRAPEECVGAC
jgi:pSer/pThr/pTyr-binding forkhead associated (FHA) protein